MLSYPCPEELILQYLRDGINQKVYQQICEYAKCGIHLKPMEYYSTVKWKKILSHGTTCANLEDIILNKASQSRKK